MKYRQIDNSFSLSDFGIDFFVGFFDDVIDSSVCCDETCRWK